MSPDSFDPERGAASGLVGRAGEKLSDALYNSIRDEMIYGETPAGDDRISPRELSERFNVSPTPVREALMRLAAEGLIESIPRRGFRRTKPSPEQVRHLWQVRMGLEVNAGELAIERLKNGEVGPGEVEALQAAVRAAHENWEQTSGREQIETNADFHTRIVAMSGNPLLVTLYESIQLRYVSNKVRQGVEGWRARREVEFREHQAIVDALAKKDADAYRIAAQAHVRRSMADALKDIETE